MPKSLIVGNWKMNTTVSSAVSLAENIRNNLTEPPLLDVILCPPFISLVPVYQSLKGSPISLGAQNLYPSDGGLSCTGEISAAMLSQVCKFVILGHSDRRMYFSESNDFINSKVLAALSANISPILCIGESLSERNSGRTNEIISAQLKANLNGIGQSSDIIIAYEPLWAIGTGRSAKPSAVQRIMAGLRNVLSEIPGIQAKHARLLYGGSVDVSNVESFLSQQDINGVLVGGASLEATSFCQIVDLASKIGS